MENTIYNPGIKLRENSEAFPSKVAFELGYEAQNQVKYRSYTFHDLEQLSDQYAHYLSQCGLKQGDKTIIMVQPSLSLFAIVFALFKVGAVPVIVDPGMGIKRMLHSYKSTKPTGFIGSRIPHIIKKISPKTFATIDTSILLKGDQLHSKQFRSHSDYNPKVPFNIANTSREALAIVNFTTGSTGPAKGVSFTYKMVEAMSQTIQTHFEIVEDHVDLVTSPLFGVLNVLMGNTSILPVMDPTKPAKVNPLNIINPINEFKVRSMFASPALLNQVGGYGVRNAVKLPSLKSVTSGGAPITTGTLKNFSQLLSSPAHLSITWGATEGLPLSTITAKEVFDHALEHTHQGKGNCIGKTIPGVQVRIIPIVEEVISSFDQTKILETGQIGELVVTGGNVSTSYFKNPEADRNHKIYEGNAVWHRTGDLGWMDQNKNIWFCGRKSQRVFVNPEVGELYTVQVEGMVNQHPAVYRSALIGIPTPTGKQPVVCLELNVTHKDKDHAVIRKEVLELLANHEFTKSIKQVVVEDKFPVDIRHNAKIKREELTRKYQQRFENGRKTELHKPSHRLKFHYSMIVPILGWLFIAWGIVYPFEHPVLKAIWWIDIFLSVGVHAVQLLVGIPKGLKNGYSNWSSGIYTFIFGATWWKAILK